MDVSVSGITVKRVYVCRNGGHGGSVVGFFAFRPEGCRFECRSGHHVETFSTFLTHNALHYKCICTAEAWKCTSQLGMYEEEGWYQRSVYCIVMGLFRGVRFPDSNPPNEIVLAIKDYKCKKIHPKSMETSWNSKNPPKFLSGFSIVCRWYCLPWELVSSFGNYFKLFCILCHNMLPFSSSAMQNYFSNATLLWGELVWLRLPDCSGWRRNSRLASSLSDPLVTPTGPASSSTGWRHALTHTGESYDWI